MTTIIHDPVTQDGDFRVEDSPGRRVLARLHRLWRSGEAKWIRGRMRDERNGFCLLGGIEHASFLLYKEEGLDVTAARKEAQSLVSRAMASDGYGSGDIPYINDRRMSRVEQPLILIENAVRLGAGS